ncbi:DUF4179 domain-containing protein [Paenibacillus massiliensis]|uniref:DUF4179 domain-containing protein n=1 Tax=Paenibacillus massiliensis TaxID=225917 RepID=UPI00037C396E|nr:DUF4179 domain-containing protein [Paenibacillus massiliensis]
MKHIENRLNQQLNHEDGLTYPDFNKMWSQIETAIDTQAEAHEGAVGTVSFGKGIQRSQRKNGLIIPKIKARGWRRAVMLASISAVIIAAPVYAAFQVDWTHLLNGRSGVQNALAQNLGQTIEQSVTKDGITLTIHTAVVDENRTVILYSLDTGEYGKNLWQFADMELTDEQGNRIEGRVGRQMWNEQAGRYIGYFESNWTPKSEQATIKLTAGKLQFFSNQQKEIPLDISKLGEQQFAIEQDGISKLVVQAFPRGEDSLMLSTGVFFAQPEVREWAAPQVNAYYNSDEPVRISDGAFGKPGDHGEYTGQQYYKPVDITREGTIYKLDYTRRDAIVDQQWTFSLHLNKQQMEAGTLHSHLGLTVPDTEQPVVLKDLIITPTQIRLTAEHEERHYRFPFVNYELEVDGHRLDTTLWYSDKGEAHLSKLHAERPLDLEITEASTIKLIGRHLIEYHDGDEYPPILLENISSERQSFMQDIGGYPVKWTYYREDGNLFVESESADPLFGGVNQTHIGKGKERIIGKPLTVNFAGDGNNKAIDVYKNYVADSAEIYMFYYITERPDEQFTMQLRP